MIKSIEFPNDGKGYVFAKIEKPYPPEKSRYESFDRNTMKRIPATKNPTYNALMKEYKDNMKYWRKHKDDYISPNCAKNLIGHKFEFQDSKVNVIFGPNGSGKTTIIKAIAGNAMCTDGFTSFEQPLEFGWMIEENMVYDLTKIIEKKKLNSSIVEWDGIPIYYDNFEQTRMKNSNTLGGFSGSIIGEDLGSEMLYRLGSNRLSAGQHSMYILNKIIRVASNPVSMEEILEKANEMYSRSNDIWKKCVKVQLDYFKKYPRFNDKVYPTLMFDEIDKSLDIETIWKLYTVIFPKIVEKLDNQIILVSHNPLVLSKEIYDNPCYNIISIDPEYTIEMKEMLHGVTF